MNKLQKKIEMVFTQTFGRTPVKERLDDILKQAIDLSRYQDIKQLKEEAGDLLASLLQLHNECEWDAEETVQSSLLKIDRRKHQYQGLGRKIRVAIYGGAFDPIHNGHMAVAKFVLNSSKTFDEVWLMPCFQHMNNKQMVSHEHRLNMCELAAQGDLRIKVSNYEIANHLIGETYLVVKKLSEEPVYKDKYEFSQIIGLDNASSFTNWVNSAYLEKICRFVVVARAGVSFDPYKTNWFLNAPHMYLQPEMPLPEISSSQIREDFKKPVGKCGSLMPQKVLQYILDNNELYIPKNV